MGKTLFEEETYEVVDGQYMWGSNMISLKITAPDLRDVFHLVLTPKQARKLAKQLKKQAQAMDAQNTWERDNG